MRKRGGAVHVATTRRHYKGKTYETHLLRRSFREGGRVKTETLGNISHLPAELIELVRRGLAGERFVPATAALEIVRSLPHGHVVAVLGTLRALDLERLVDARPGRRRDLVVAMIVARLLAPGSKLATTRRWTSSTLADSLGVADADEDELYGALDWLLERQARIEAGLARRHLAEGALVLYDVSSSYVTGRRCELAAHGYSRDHRPDRPQVVYGLLLDAAGRPLAVEAYRGNTADPATVEDQLDKLQARFGLSEVVLAGDRGMLTAARIERLRERGGIGWLSCLRAPDIARLAKGGALQLSLFDETDLAEIASPDFPGERLVVCRNPALAAERARKREALLAATEVDLARIAATVGAGRLRRAEAIGLRVGRALGRSKVAKHFRTEIAEGSLRFARDEERIAAEAALDGLYVVRTSIAPGRLDAAGVVRAYKGLSRAEQAFRTFKLDLGVRPIFHYRERRVRAHLLLCLLACYVRWHLERAWAPLLFADEERPEPIDPVAPALRSEAALAKARTQRLPDGTPVHSFGTLLAELATLTRNRILPAGAPEAAAFELVAIPTPLQARALSLLGLTPSSV